jgi:hypothetical protein
MSKQSGNEYEAREEDAANVYGYTGRKRHAFACIREYQALATVPGVHW